ncbi:MAG: hypothetical protein V1792_22855 [Pseudomonadota bacterium]
MKDSEEGGVRSCFLNRAGHLTPALWMFRFKKQDLTPPALATEAISQLGRRLREIRRRFFEEGGTLLTSEELDREIAERRGGSYRFEDED